jgi:hypothetical protein
VAAKTAFISHISAETELAQGLKARLTRDFLGMLDIFVSSDRHTIEAGSRWLEEVDRALSTADVELVLCSKASVGRPWVNFEAGAAWLRGIPVVPVCHSGFTLAQLPVPLSMLQGVELGMGGLQKLYDTIARVLGVSTPAVDFSVAASELRQLEERQLRNADVIERVDNPRVLCAASAQYAEPNFGFHLDVEVLRAIFGAERVTVESATTRSRLTELLARENYEIVHLVLPVERKTGSLLFSRVDLRTHEPVGRADRLSPEGLAALLVESQTRLVVLATCNALLLAVDIAHVANMAAADADISGGDAAEWSECFYGLLRQGKSVHKAMDLAKVQVDVPIRAVRQRDVAFTFNH